MRTRIVKGIITLSVFLTVITGFIPGAAAVSTSKKLIPLGSTVGIKLSSEGVMVVGIPDKMKDGTGSSPALEAGLRQGDIITRIGAAKIESKDDLKGAIEKLSGEATSIQVLRAGRTMQFTITPYPSGDGKYELGLWLRDGIAGIGTMTFYDPESRYFGALGHSISDSEAGVEVPLRQGVIARSSVTGVAAGKAGTPGQLQGSFDFDDVLGRITVNAQCGIFGVLDNSDFTGGREPISIASAGELHTGPASILANVSGNEVKEYSVEISRVYTGAEADSRSMMITVTDTQLIEKTGGIVQGMSGSPIIQDGKLVGAVTHVLINDPERGYGVSIERMLDIAENAQNQLAA